MSGGKEWMGSIGTPDAERASAEDEPPPKKDRESSEEDSESQEDRITERTESMTSALLSALVEAMPGPKQRAAAAARADAFELIDLGRTSERPDAAAAAKDVVTILEEISAGHRPADDANIDLVLRASSILGRLFLAKSDAERDIEWSKMQGLMTEAAELAAALDEERDPEIAEAEAGELTRIFAEEAREHIHSARQAVAVLEENRGNETALRMAFRATHTLKGAAGAVGEHQLVEEAHALEETWSGVMSGLHVLDGTLLSLAGKSLDRVEKHVDRACSLVDSADSPMTGDPLRGPLEASTSTDSSTTSEDEGACISSQPAQEARETICGCLDAPVEHKPAAQDVEKANTSTVRVKTADLDELQLAATELGSARTSSIEAALRLRRHGRLARQTRLELASRVDAFLSDHIHPISRRSTTTNDRRLDSRARHEALAFGSELAALDEELSSTIEDISMLAAELLQDMERIGGLAEEIRRNVTEMRFVPIADVLERYGSPAREWAREAGRDARILVSAAGVNVDGSVAESLRGPVVQLLRNAIAHGIESPEDRLTQGKNPRGTIVLHAWRDGGDLILEVEDDGRGMHPSALRKAAVEKGALTEQGARSLPDSRLADLVFLPGFTTTADADDLAGRGIGLDIAASTIARLGGVMSVSSTPGLGTRFSARMPPTASMLPVLGLRCGRASLALPLAAVRETLLLDRVSIASAVNGDEPIRWKEMEPPVLLLADVVGESFDINDGAASLPAVVLGHGGRHAILVAEALRGRDEGRLLQLGSILESIPQYAGALVGGSGRTDLVLDASYLLSAASGIRPI